MRNSEKRVGYISKRIGAKLDLEIREGSRYDLMQLLSKKDLAFIVFIFINCRGKLSVSIMQYQDCFVMILDH